MAVTVAVIVAVNKLTHAVVRLTEALYKPESRGFDFRWSHWKFP